MLYCVEYVDGNAEELPLKDIVQMVTVYQQLVLLVVKLSRKGSNYLSKILPYRMKLRPRNGRTKFS